MLSKFGYGFLRKKKLYFKDVDNFYLHDKFILKKCQLLVKTNTIKSYLQKSPGAKIINLKKKIVDSQFNTVIQVYNGNKWLPITVTSLKIGRRVKDFVLTKRMGTGIHRIVKTKK